MRRAGWAAFVIILSGCGSFTLPAAVQLADGTALIGTTTAAVSGGTFSVASADGAITCSGTYDALDMTPTISVPVSCSNGLYGNAVVTRAPNGMSGEGFAFVSDGTVATLAFGNGAGAILTQENNPASVATQTSVASHSAAAAPARRRTYRHYYTGPRGGCYYLTASGYKQYVDRSMCR